MIRRSLMLLLAFCAGVTPLHSRIPQFKTEHLTTGHGLSQSTVFSIHQDLKGFLWVGTGDGLNRYDGYSFRVFRNDPDDSTSISDNTVFAIEGDTSGNLWLGTERGLVVCDMRTLHFRRLADEPRFAGTHIGHPVTALVLDRSGGLWIGSSAGLSRLDLHAGVLDSFPAFSPSRPRMFAVKPLWLDDNGDVWIRHPGGFDVYTVATRGFRQPTLPAGSSYGIPTALMRDHSGTLWLGTSAGGLFELADVGWKNHRHDPLDAKSINDDHIHCIVEDDYGTLWVGTESGGINYFERRTSTFNRLNPGSEVEAAQRFQEATTMLKDRSGLIVVGHDGAGILKVNPHPPKFTTLMFPSTAKTTGDNFLKSVLIDRNDRLWAGTFDRGIKRLDRVNGELVTYIHNPGNPYSVRSNSIHEIAEDRSGNIWIGGMGGVDLYEERTGIFHRIPTVRYDSSERQGIIRAIVVGAEGTLWAAGTHGLLKFNRERTIFESIPLVDRRGNMVRTELECLFPDDRGGLWIGSYGMGLIHRPALGSVELVNPPLNPAAYSSADVVKSIHGEGDSVLWVGTEQGLGRFHITSRTWRRYFQRDGMPNDFIYGILSDDHGRLWLSTNKGLCCADLRDGDHPRFRNYTTEDGLQSSEFNTGVFFRAKDGRMAFGGVNGVNVFHPDSILDNPVVPNVVLTGFKKFDLPVGLPVDIGSMDEIELSHEETVFSFEFAGLEFTNPLLNTYAYRLEGFDPEWVYCGTRRDVRYTLLEPGNYVFRVKAANSDGVWNEADTSIRVLIPPPFWRQGWFIALSLVVVGSGFAGTVRYVSTRKLKARLKELEIQQQLQDERERISRDLHDNVGAQLVSIISGLDLLEKYSPSENRKTQRLVDSLRDDARSSMTLLRETIRALKSSGMTLEQFSDQVRSYAQKQEAVSDSVNVTVEADGTLSQMLSPLEVLNCFRIIQEAVTNSVKHSRARSIAIRLSSTAVNRLVIHVIDNGQSSGSQTDPLCGNGLLNMKKRAEEMGGTITFGAGSEAGWEVRLEVPA